MYDNYSTALYGVIDRIINDDGISEEILQDTFLRIWDKIGSYDPAKGRLFTWMLNIARNLAIDKTRSREISKDRKTDDIDNLVNRIDRKDQAEQNIEIIGLKEILNRLPDDQRFVVDYLYLKGYTQSELSEEFNIPLGTVKTRARLAMTELRTLLKVNS